MTYEVQEISRILRDEGIDSETAERLARAIVDAYRKDGYRLTSVDGPSHDD